VTRRVLVYDGDCPLCVATSERLERAGHLPEGGRRAFQALPEDQAKRLLDAGFADRMAVVDEDSGEIRTGLPALLWVFEGRPAPLWARVASRRPWSAVASFAYRVVASNRRAIAPRSPGRPPCACEPGEDGRLTAAFAGALAVAAGAVAAVEAAAVANLHPGRGLLGPRLLRAAEALPWVVVAVPALRRFPGAVSRLAAFSWSAAVSALAALPAFALGALLRPPFAGAALALGLVARLAVLARMELRRRPLGAPAYLLPWTAGFAAVAAFALVLSV
jgi:predicted DCC family thiol-disulfide oxidoreductase YuxK